MSRTLPLYLGNRPSAPNADLPVLDKYTGEVVARVALAGPEVIDAAIARAADAARPLREMASYERAAVLRHCARRFEERAEELARDLCAEAGKPIQASRAEVGRSIDTFRIAAEEATRITGEVLPLDVTPRARGYTGLWKRFPVAPCAFVSPFNFPINLAAHKIAPALAAGASFVLKPASATPLGALAIGAVLAETDLPPGAFSILPARRADADRLVTDPRVRLLSFTGSPEVGWDLKARAGKKRVVLELGGNAAVVVDRDWDVDDAVRRVVIGAFFQSGQSCIKTQRVLVHAEILDAFVERFVSATRALVTGDPRDERTFVGPLITEDDAVRLQGWIHAAVARGARLLCGGGRRGALLEPTILTDVPRDEPVVAREAFGPVAVLSSFTDFERALDEVDDSAYGLQAGVFTRDYYKAQRAFERLEVGAVVLGDVPSWRVDSMPYGGVKDSGLGREGVRFAIEELTERRLLVARTP